MHLLADVRAPVAFDYRLRSSVRARPGTQWQTQDEDEASERVAHDGKVALHNMILSSKVGNIIFALFAKVNYSILILIQY